MSGFPPAIRKIILGRDGNRCVLCLRASQQIHHRRPRGMGGSKRPETSCASNGVVLCGSGTTGCHGEVEHKRDMYLADGYLVLQRQDPRSTPILIRGQWVLLTEDGGMVPCP